MRFPESFNHRLKVESPDVVDWLLCGNRHQMFDFGRLPSEDELRKDFRASRAVIRSVLGELANLGILERRRAVGTYSDKPFEEKFLGRDRHLVANVALSYVVMSSEVVIGNVVSDEIFGMSGEILRVERATYLGDDPLGYWVIYLPSDVGETIPEIFWMQSIQNLAHYLGKGPLTVKYDFTAVLADEYVASVLEVPAGCPLLHIERRYYVDNQLLFVSFGRRVGVRLSVGTQLEEP